jgi:hypothetical protein
MVGKNIATLGNDIAFTKRAQAFLPAILGLDSRPGYLCIPHIIRPSKSQSATGMNATNVFFFGLVLDFDMLLLDRADPTRAIVV